MNRIITASRKTDAVISVCQNNERKLIEIKGVNATAERIFGMPAEQLKSLSLYDVINPECRNAIVANIVYEQGGNDLASVLNKIENFHVMSVDGNQILVSIRAFYTLPVDGNPTFELLIRDVTLYNAIETTKKLLIEKRKLNMDADFDDGLMDVYSFMQAMEGITTFIAFNPVEACFVVIELTNFHSIQDNFGLRAGANMIKAFVDRYTRSTRNEDMIAHINHDPNLFGALLFNCNSEDAIKVLDRIRNKVCGLPVSVDIHNKIYIDIKAGCMPINKDTNVHQLLQECPRLLGN